MRKGQFLESQIDKVIEVVKSQGYWGQKNHPHRTEKGTYLEGEPFDYFIITDKVKYAFDAKESHSIRWQFKQKDIKQANNLKKLKKCGFDAFFLVYFANEHKVIRFDVDQFISALEQKRMHLKSDEGMVFDFKEVL